VSGLTLGGGMGWLAGKFGTTADNVIAMDLVTADGRILQASEEQNNDLFWGLRGGGGNLGVVTSFEYRTHQLEEVEGGFLVYPIESLGEFLNFYQDFMRNAPDDLMVEISVAHFGRPFLIVTICFSGDKAASDSALAPIRRFSHPLIDSVRNVAFPQLTVPTAEVMDFINSQTVEDSNDSVEADGYYNHWRGASVPEWTEPAIKTFVQCLERAPRDWSIGIGHFMHGAASRVADRSTALLREEYSSSFFFNLGWNHSSLSEKSMAWVDQSIEAMSPYVSSGTFVNYLSSNSAEAVKNAYGLNYSRLQKLKNSYDPENIFHLNRNIRA